MSKNESETEIVKHATNLLDRLRQGKITRPESSGMVYVDLKTGKTGLIRLGSQEAEIFVQSLHHQPDETE